MKYEIRYHSIQSDHILAVPEFSHKEIVDAKTRQHVIRYVKKNDTVSILPAMLVE